MSMPPIAMLVWPYYIQSTAGIFAKPGAFDDILESLRVPGQQQVKVPVLVNHCCQLRIADSCNLFADSFGLRAIVQPRDNLVARLLLSAMQTDEHSHNEASLTASWTRETSGEVITVTEISEISITWAARRAQTRAEIVGGYHGPILKNAHDRLLNLTATHQQSAA